MGIDFTSKNFPYVLEFFDDEQTEEGHEEPANESVRSAVEEYEHPVLSVTGLKNTVNKFIAYGNSKEDEIKGEIKKDVLKDIIQYAYKEKFPLDALIVALDMKERLDKRSGASDAGEIAEKMRGYVDELKDTLGRQPNNAEMFMAYCLESASKVKQILEKAEQKPYEKAAPIGSKYDKYIFKKLVGEEEKDRNNKEVLQYFKKRMMNGSTVFSHLPLGDPISNDFS